MFGHFRKRFPEDVWKRNNELIATKAIALTSKKPKKDPDNNDNNPSSPDTKNKWKRLVDETCAPEDINYPTDLKLHNKAREQDEQVLDILRKAMPKGTIIPRNYCQKARKVFKRFKKPKGQPKKLRKTLRQQLGFLGRKLRTIEKQYQTASLEEFSTRQYKTLFVISELYRR